MIDFLREFGVLVGLAILGVFLVVESLIKRACRHEWEDKDRIVEEDFNLYLNKMVAHRQFQVCRCKKCGRWRSFEV